jgi:transcriptional regulator with XRE-family HTH domain
MGKFNRKKDMKTRQEIGGWDVSETPFGSDVRKVRLRAGLTQRESAELVGMDVSNWERIESGTRNMRARSWAVFLERIEDRARIRRLEKDLALASEALRLYRLAIDLTAGLGCVGSPRGEGDLPT